MFILTNEQRKCFGLAPIQDNWELIKLKLSKYDKNASYAYKEGNVIKKVIHVSEDFRCDNEELYIECELNEQLSEDGTMLLPKTAKGKPVKLTASTIGKRKAIGMVFSYSHGKLSLYNTNTDQNYYQSIYEDLYIPNLEALSLWIQEWCDNTGEKELEDITSFSLRKRHRHKYKEGDYFKFKINRNTYIYGRILLSYDRLRKEKIPFWDTFFGKPLLVGTYRMITNRGDISIEELSDLEMLPTHLIMDNPFYYGEYEIIGNEKVVLEKEDLPIHYGGGKGYRENCIYFQRGTTFIKIDNEKALFDKFDNTAIGWTLNLNLPVLEKCIKEQSNNAYWKEYKTYGNDFRNPAFKKEWDQVVAQMTKYISKDMLMDMKTHEIIVAD